MTEGLAHEPAEPGPGPDVIHIGHVTDIDGDTLSVAVCGSQVLIGSPHDILGLSYPLDAGGVGELAKLLAYATWEAARHT